MSANPLSEAASAEAMRRRPNDGGPAFPVHGGGHTDDDARNHTLGGGMSLRDYFAAKAMAALIVNDKENCGAVDVSSQGDTPIPGIVPGTWGGHAFLAYEIADAMLAERSKARA